MAKRTPHDDLQELRAQITDLHQRVAALESHAPEARQLSHAAVLEILADNPYAELEVLRATQVAGRHYQPGQRLRGDLCPRLADLVRSGLAVGIPVDTAAQARDAHQLAQANREAARAELELAKAKAAAQAAQVIAEVTEELDPAAQAAQVIAEVTEELDPAEE